ncbi:amidase family protein [Ligilactobacillus sp. LYQ139]|uniref:amidase family protein n=1 Tax=Ligilactobacillus sp. LYQ139 TaxID=3378800 RepID=UPI00385195F0
MNNRLFLRTIRNLIIISLISILCFTPAVAVAAQVSATAISSTNIKATSSSQQSKISLTSAAQSTTNNHSTEISHVNVSKNAAAQSTSSKIAVSKPVTSMSSSSVTPLYKTKPLVASTSNNSSISQLVQGKSALQLAHLIKNGTITPQELLAYTYERIKQLNPQLNSVIYTNPAYAEAQLKALQQHNPQTMPFYGVPLLIKGLDQPLKGYPNTNGLTFEAKQTYSYTGSFVKRLQQLGFIVIGETNFPELGLINVTTSLLHGTAHNPWDLTRNPGGSSGGSAAAVAADIVPIATGNDAGGSLRIPASWSGVIGLKPTQGLILGDPTTPSVVNFVDARNVSDMNTLLTYLAKPDQVSKLQAVPTDLTRLKIAYTDKSPVGTPVSPAARQAVHQAVDFLRAHGFTVVRQDAPVNGVKLMQNYFLRALSDGQVANFLCQHFLHRNLTPNDINTVVSPMTVALYLASLKAPHDIENQWTHEIQLIHQQMTAFHQEYPLYLTPTTATVAPKNDDPAFLPHEVALLRQINKLPFNAQMKLIYNAWLHGLTKTPFTQLANLAGEPAISLPTYISPAGLPLGIQFEGSQYSDRILLALAQFFADHGQFKWSRTTQLNTLTTQRTPTKHFCYRAKSSSYSYSPTRCNYCQKAPTSGYKYQTLQVVASGSNPSSFANKKMHIKKLPATGNHLALGIILCGWGLLGAATIFIKITRKH